jgi:MYXO-CTERM domain-containing protein
MMTCPMGQFCMGGTCQDACTGVVCPTNQVCSAGACVDDVDHVTDAGSTPLSDSGLNGGNDSGVTSGDGGLGDGASRSDATIDGAVGDGGSTGSGRGCGCHVTPARMPSRIGLTALVAMGLFAAGQRRRRKNGASRVA